MRYTLHPHPFQCLTTALTLRSPLTHALIYQTNRLLHTSQQHLVYLSIFAQSNCVTELSYLLCLTNKKSANRQCLGFLFCKWQSTSCLIQSDSMKEQDTAVLQQTYRLYVEYHFKKPVLLQCMRAQVWKHIIHFNLFKPLVPLFFLFSCK